jgi:hypothetical protein
VILGVAWLTFGVLDLTTDSAPAGGIWIVLGVVATASGAARLIERDEANDQSGTHGVHLDALHRR